MLVAFPAKKLNNVRSEKGHMKRMKFSKIFGSNLGVAYDELALVSALVAGVGAFAMVSMPWDKMGVGSGSPAQSMIDQLAIIETANLAFHDRYRLWPHEVTDGTPTRNISVLSDQTAMKFPYSAMRNFEQLLPTEEFELSGKTLQHSIGQGGRVTQQAVSEAGERYIEVTFEDVPLITARKIDESIDGYYDPEIGRVSLSFQESIVDAETVDLHYRANRL